ncbi:MAG: E3 binding domain-containing protein, partial [Schleiferiaceae bacterium]
MALVITMPRLSDTMTEGVVAKWHAKVGDQITEGKLLAEIETDKATMDFEAFPGQEGVLLHVGVQEGQTAPVDAILAILGTAGEDISALLSGGTPAAAPVEAPAAAPAVAPAAAPAVEVAAPAPVAATPAPAAPAPSTDGRVKASPLARSLAQELGLSLAGIQGTGDGGRITKRDVELAAASPASASAAAPSSAVAYPSSGHTDTPISQMRKTIAKRLAESKFTAPHFYLTIAVDMSAAAAARAEINAGGDVKISFNDLVVKSVAKAL